MDSGRTQTRAAAISAASARQGVTAVSWMQHSLMNKRPSGPIDLEAIDPEATREAELDRHRWPVGTVNGGLQ